MITKRTLEKWRKDSLFFKPEAAKINLESARADDKVAVDYIVRGYEELHNRILRLTQILLDQHLVRRK